VQSKMLWKKFLEVQVFDCAFALLRRSKAQRKDIIDAKRGS
jgi:hypothetical protein